MKKVREKSVIKEKSARYSFLKKELDDLDIKGEYQRLKKTLTLGTKKMNFEALASAIDFAAENARSAAMLWLSARELRERYEDNDYAITYAELVNEATIELEKAKRNGKASGQISEAKIRNWIIKNKEETYEEITETLRSLKRNEMILAILKDQCESRKSLLQSQGKMAERRPQVSGFDDD